MSLIDRYICWLFLRVSLCSAACLIGLIVLIDVAGNFEEFIGFGDHSLRGFLRAIGPVSDTAMIKTQVSGPAVLIRLGVEVP